MSETNAPLRVLVVGALGRMGERVRAALAEAPDARLAAALEAPGHPRSGERLAEGVRLSDEPKQALARVDVAIDFSVPDSCLALLRAAAEARVPCVSGTTGLAPDQRAEVERLAACVPVVLAPNFSVAVNVLVHLVREAARLLPDSFDAEILELHHAAKRDAPSGTALRLAAAVAEARGGVRTPTRVLARQGETGARPAGAVGIQSLRGGDNPGEHTVFLLGRGERIELAHRAGSRDHFARGALQAARWIRGRPPGLYDMEQVLGLRT